MEEASSANLNFQSRSAAGSRPKRPVPTLLMPRRRLPPVPVARSRRGPLTTKRTAKVPGRILPLRSARAIPRRRSRRQARHACSLFNGMLIIRQQEAEVKQNDQELLAEASARDFELVVDADEI